MEQIVPIAITIHIPTITRQRPHLCRKGRRRTPFHQHHLLLHPLKITLPRTPEQVWLIILLLSLSLSLDLLTRQCVQFQLFGCFGVNIVSISCVSSIRCVTISVIISAIIKGATLFYTKTTFISISIAINIITTNRFL